jgi:uncharacterized protein (DUF302 family)
VEAQPALARITHAARPWRAHCEGNADSGGGVHRLCVAAIATILLEELEEDIMIEQRTGYGITVSVHLPYDQAVERIRAELAKEGFGVLTEIDVRTTLKSKIGAEFRPYLIIGACNPTLAHKALTAEIDIGLLLPCNVIVYEADTPGETVIAAMDPIQALDLAGNTAIRPVAEEARSRLVRALEGTQQ